MKGYGGALAPRPLRRSLIGPRCSRCRPSASSMPTGCRARVNIDYHVDVDRHYYSVPHPLVHADARRPPVGDDGRDLPARHARSGCMRRSIGARPPHHRRRAHAEGAPRASGVESLAPVRWGATIGPETATLVEQILASRPHPEQGYRSCLGLLRLAKRYGPARARTPPARGRSPSAPGRIATSTRCSSTGSISTRSRSTRPTPAPRRPCQRPRAGLLPPKETPHADRTDPSTASAPCA